MEGQEDGDFVFCALDLVQEFFEVAAGDEFGFWWLFLGQLDFDALTGRLLYRGGNKAPGIGHGFGGGDFGFRIDDLLPLLGGYAGNFAVHDLLEPILPDGFVSSDGSGAIDMDLGSAAGLSGGNVGIYRLGDGEVCGGGWLLGFGFEGHKLLLDLFFGGAGNVDHFTVHGDTGIPGT